MQLVSAATSALSGTITLVIASYLSDDEVISMLSGSSKYLALRENVYRLVIHPKISDDERFQRLSDLQDEYTRLDEAYSKFFTITRRRTRKPLLSHIENEEVERLHREIKRSERSTSAT